MIHDFPYTNFHEMNLDFIMSLAMKSLGLHLETQGNYLKLVNQAGEDISKLEITYAQTALQDTHGHDIDSYIVNAGVNGNAVIFTTGAGIIKSVTVPYATSALNDTNGNAITSYIKGVTVSGNDLVITDGNNNTVSVTVPFATNANKATYDDQGKAIRSYFASVSASNNKLVFADADGHTTEITVPYASVAGTADQSADGISAVNVAGNTIVITTTDGDTFTITAPYAVKALSDDQNNVLTHAYVASVINDPQTGKLTFKAKDGSTIAEIVPTVSSAVKDSYGNTIADFVKTIATSAQSNYIPVTHGNGDVDSLTVNYSTTAWKDTYGNVIGNTYIKRLQNITDPQTGKNMIVAYNGENSELFRFEVVASVAETDENGKAITSYVADIVATANGFNVIDGDGNTLRTITYPSASTLTLRQRVNAFVDGWKGYAPDPTDPNVDPYPIVEELVDGNNVVVSQIPVPSVYPVKIPVSYSGVISSWSFDNVPLDFWYDSDDWRKMYGAHNAFDDITVLGVVSEDPNIIATFYQIGPIAGAQPQDGFTIEVTLHNMTNQGYTPQSDIYVLVALGKSYN